MTGAQHSSPQAAAPPGFRVLLIGIDNYRDIPLRGCVNDILDFERFLRAELHVPDTAITKLLAPHSQSSAEATPLPTKARIIAELQAIAAAPEVAGSQVLIYYAGHGTQRYFSQAEANYEALVPMDYEREPASLLFDFELGPLLQAIAQRSESLTVILDCCNSAGILSFTPDEEGTSPRRSRFLPSNDHADAPLPVLPVAAPPSSLRSAAELDGRYTILAAAQSNEPAEELDRGEHEGGPRGALSYALLQLLAAEFRGRLGELRWAELWGPLRAKLRTLGTNQRPNLVGSLGRTVLGAAGARYDNGVAVQARDDGSFELAGGALAGLGPGATVAIYAPFAPPAFAPLGSAQDLEDRRGILVVTTSDSWSAIAQPVAGTTPDLTGSGRARLLSYGAAERLRVGCSPSCPDWVRQALEQQAANFGYYCVPSTGPATQTPTDSAAPEVLLGQDADGNLLVGDLIYSSEPGAVPGPMGTIPVPRQLNERQRRPWMLQALQAALLHYSHYVVPARLGRLAERPESPLPAGSLELAAVAAGDSATVNAMVQDTRRIRELHPDGNGRVQIPEGLPICFRIHNNSWAPLFVTLVLCDGQGRLRQLAPPQQLAPCTGSFIWPAGFQIGVPFEFALLARPVSIERIYAIATSSPDVDFRWFNESLTLQQAITGEAPPISFTDKPAAAEPPPLAWTVAQLQLELRPR